MQFAFEASSYIMICRKSGWKPLKKIKFLVGINICDKLCNWVKLYQIFKTAFSPFILQPSLALSTLKMHDNP